MILLLRRTFVVETDSFGGARYKTCAVPQELPDSEIDRLMEQSALDAFVRERNRPPLDRCSGPEFEADLIAFHRSRGGEQLARQIRDKRIMWYDSHCLSSQMKKSY
jgi:hypothetical protein